jgi:O-antigen ligase
MPALVAAILCFSMLVATTSRAGFFATLVGLAVLAVLAIPLAAKRDTMGWAALAASLLAFGAYGLFLVNGDTLTAQLDAFVETGPDNVRLVLWGAAARMIENSPWLGLGLGTFENTYPLYANAVLPYVMDKAHNDYLELAAGWGLPAAAAWCLALLWLNLLCIRGIFVRRRNRHYAILAVGASALVAAHSLFDFSLQIPAVALLYAVILGLGVGQSFRTGEV